MIGILFISDIQNCRSFRNITYDQPDITALPCPDSSFDKVVAGNVIHLLDEPLKALKELDRVCRPGGMLIIPTYMNKDQKGETSGFASVVGKAGADFKRQFTVESYRQLFLDAGYKDLERSSINYYSIIRGGLMYEIRRYAKRYVDAVCRIIQEEPDIRSEI